MSADQPQAPDSPGDVTAPAAHVTETPPTTDPASPVTEKPSVPLAPMTLPFPANREGSPPGGLDFVDGVLVALTLLFALEMGTYAVRNDSIYMNLASGRDLLNGSYNPFSGKDPYSWTGSGWVNHSWLSSVLIYKIHQAGGFAGLIAVKALLVALAAFFLLRVGRVGRGWWVPALSATLAVLVARPRLILQPFVISFLFLALTLFFLQRGGRWLSRGEDKLEAGAVTWKDYWPLLVLFGFWVNLDEWFFLGPLTVALYAAGQALQPRDTPASPRSGEVKALTNILLAGAACCLINPQHILAFTLPTQLGLSPTARLLAQDGQLEVMFWSPFNKYHFQKSNISVSHLAYFLLAVLTLGSFAVNLRGFRAWRALVAGFFLGLSAYHQRAVPFFAVVAAPILALNVQEAVARSRESRPLRRRDPLVALGRGFGFLLLLGLLVTGWVGWLHQRPYERNRVSLADDIDPSLRETAEFLGKLHAEGKLPANSRGFSISYELGNALAWFAPKVQSSFDNRYSVFSEVAADHIAARLHLMGPPGSPPEMQRPDWRAILERRKADYLVVYGAEVAALGAPLSWLTESWEEKPKKDWVLIDFNRHAAVFARKGSELVAAPVDFNRLCYAPAPEKLAPPDGMKQLPRLRLLWEDFTNPLPLRLWEGDEASMHELLYRVGMLPQARENLGTVNATLAAGSVLNSLPVSLAVAPAALSFATLQGALRIQKGEFERRADLPADLRFPHFVMDAFLNRQKLDGGPREQLLLAIRAARRGLGKRSDDYRTHFALGNTYYQMAIGTRERIWATELHWSDREKAAALNASPLQHLRQVQIMAALQNALLYRTDNELVHGQLADLYGRLGQRDPRSGEESMGYRDLELQHRKAELKMHRAAGPRQRETREQFTARIKGMQERLDDLDKKVQTWQNRYDNLRARFSKIQDRAWEAWKLNLAGKALQLLLDHDAGSFGREGLRMQFDLALMTGRIRDVKSWMDDLGEKSLRSNLGDITYIWQRMLVAAASGDYATADKLLLELAASDRRNVQMTGVVRMADLGVVVRNPPQDLSVGEAAALILAKAIADAPLPVSERIAHVAVKHAKRELNASLRWHGLDSTSRFLEVFETLSVVWGWQMEESMIHIFRGLLATEQGDRDKAIEAFRLAIRLTEPFARFQPATRVIAQEMLGKFEATK